MRRMWIGVGLLALVLVAGLWAAEWMDRSHGAMAKDLDRAGEFAMAGRWEDARRELDAVRENWQKKRPVTAAFADHEPLEEIDGLFAQLEIFAQGKKQTDFAAVCAYLARQLEALGDDHSLTLYNLL